MTNAERDKLNRLVHEHIEGKCVHEWNEWDGSCMKCDIDTSVRTSDKDRQLLELTPDYLGDDAYCHRLMFEEHISVLWDDSFKQPMRIGGEACFIEKGMENITPTQEQANAAILTAVLKKKGVEI